MRGNNKTRRDRLVWRILAGCLAAVLLLPLAACGEVPAGDTPFDRKAGLLEARLLAEEVEAELEDIRAEGSGFAVFLSVCDTASRAAVYTGTGDTLEAAWTDARNTTRTALEASGLEPVWVRVDVPYSKRPLSASALSWELSSHWPELYRDGLAFDPAFKTALLETELNGAKLYDYDNDKIDQTYLNNYLRKAGRPEIERLPTEFTAFRCFGWLCDENGDVIPICGEESGYGRRKIDLIDADYAAQLIRSGSDFLLDQLKEDGTFVYGYYPRFDNEIENYNIVRHASTIWSLLCRYRMDPTEETAAAIDSAVAYMLSQIVFSDEETAYLYEKKSDEIKLGGCGLAVVVLTEYMDVFETRKYEDLCRQLGNGILSLFDQETGTYYHVLNGDFSRKEAQRTVYYDGEATFALCRLYGLTEERQWLDAARRAVDHFIEADYTQYRDHWIAYSMNEITRYVTDEPDYYAFALRNVQNNLESIYQRETTYHTYLELLMASFELYDRMVRDGVAAEDFDVERFLETIYHRADRMLDGFFYPECAMYMANPQRILNTFMVRHDGYRVRIDDVQHNIGGYYLYYKNYDRLVSYGMLERIGDAGKKSL